MILLNPAVMCEVFPRVFLVLDQATGADVVYLWEATPFFWARPKLQKSLQLLKFGVGGWNCPVGKS